MSIWIHSSNGIDLRHNQRTLYCLLQGKKISQRNDMQLLQTAFNDTMTNSCSVQKKIKQDLEVYAVHEAKSAQVQSRIKFIEENERNTSSF